MALFSHTPEALLGRNDSKNPSTTCKGLTSAGRPCRRALASPQQKGKSSISALNGVIALVEEDGRVQEADFYCWQHKDQAAQKIQQEQQELRQGRKARRRRSAELVPLEERSSIDTLVQRLGIETVSEEQKRRNRKPERQPNPPVKTQTTDFADPSNRPSRTSQPRPSHAEKHSSRPSTKPPARKKSGFWASLCCASGDVENDYVEIVRHKRRTEQAHRPSHSSHSVPPPRIPQASRPWSTSVPARQSASSTAPAKPSRQRPSSNPATGNLLSLIPETCSPQTTSSLLAELIKPISVADEEGYIYIFWLTPQTKDAPPEQTARSLLTPHDRRPEYSRRISDVMTEFSFNGDEETTRGGANAGTGVGTGAKKTILLKIGRANNVTRRMNEWQRQCGYKLNLVRWYPYVSSTSSPQPSPVRKPQSLYPDLSQRPSSQSDLVHKVPCVKRVERLIHLELAEKRVLRDCETCGKEHREWFQVEASQEGVKAVDECVRRWVGWAERMQGGGTNSAASPRR